MPAKRKTRLAKQPSAGDRDQRGTAMVVRQGNCASSRLLVLPLAAGLLLGVMAPMVDRQGGMLFTSLLGSGLSLLVLECALWLRLRGQKINLAISVALRPQHYVQALVQLSIYLYWGFYWREVYDHGWLIAAQLLFAYGFDMLLGWWRRGRYVLGFGPFPIIFSINLFLWFQDEWFYLQFAMIAVGFLGKEFVRWQRDGNSVHIFNPSAFALGLFSLLLILTGTTDLTWGPEIASTLTLAPNIYGYLFAAGLVVMFFFSITLVAMTAAVTLFALSAIYTQLQGIPFFLDSEIPAAVFLGLHLLITDPSTSPRSPLGKSLFGLLYGLGVFGLYALLSAVSVPTFYDKLLCVPLLNLAVIGIDRLAAGVVSRIHWRPRWSPNVINRVAMSIWFGFFLVMSVLGKTDGMHTGDRLPFWQDTCDAGSAGACERLRQLEVSYCRDNSAWACNELGLHYRQGNIVNRDEQKSLDYFSRACALRFAPGCNNLLEPESRQRAQPKSLDLRLILREGGRNLLDMSEADLYLRACRHGWEFACTNKIGRR